MELPKDVYEYLTNFADDRTILNMLSVNKKFNDEQFFKRLMLRKYPFLLEFKTGSYKELFIRMIYYIAKLQEKYGIPYIPAPSYNPEEFYKTYENNETEIYNRAMYWAASGGNVKKVQMMLDKGATNFNSALESAALAGHIDIVKMMLESGADDINSGLQSASEGGHMNIVKFLLDKGAKSLNYSLREAANEGHLDIVKLLLDRGATALAWGLEGGAKSGNMEIVQLMLDKGAKDYNSALRGAAEYNHRDIVDLMLAKGAKDYYGALEDASFRGHIELVKLFLELIQERDGIHPGRLAESLIVARYGKYEDVVKLLKEYGAEDE